MEKKNRRNEIKDLGISRSFISRTVAVARPIPETVDIEKPYTLIINKEYIFSVTPASYSCRVEIINSYLLCAQ